MDRREALKQTALIMGYAVSASALAGVMSGCGVDSGHESSAVSNSSPADWEPQFFTTEEIEQISEMCNTIIPETSTPGAKSARVHEFIDEMLGGYYQLREQKEFKRGLVTCNEDCRHLYGRFFVQCQPEQRHDYLVDLDRNTLTMLDSGEPSPLSSRPFFAMMKELTWLGYFTSELVGEQVLNYDPVPGIYHGCLPLEETNGRMWSL